MNLQQLIDDTEDYGTLDLEFDEYYGKIEIDRPIIINGNGSTVCARQGPVVTIISGDVELKHIRLEVTEFSEDNSETSLALSVKDNINTQLSNVVVKGNVKGVVLEDGDWDYPEALHIWPVAPGKRNHFVFDMQVPLSCSLETDITGLRILNPGLREPGSHTIQLEVDLLKPNTILFGQIEIKSTYLSRIISVSGGTYGIPEDLVEPNRDNPIHLNKKSESQPFKQIETSERLLPKQKGKKNLKIWFFGILCLILAVSSIISFSDIFIEPSVSPSNKEADKDVIAPSGEVHGIKRVYYQGDDVNFTILAQDDTLLKQLEFIVKNTSVKELWNIEKPSIKQKTNFSTQNQTPGKYEYILTITDHAQNVKEINGTFVLKARPDIVKPSGEISGIKDSYSQDDRIEYTLEARDNQALKKMVFQVLSPTGNAAVKNEWKLSGKDVQRNSSFPTQDQTPGTYTYSLQLYDAAGNGAVVKGRFELLERAKASPTPAAIPPELTFSAKRSLICRASIPLSQAANEHTPMKTAKRRISEISADFLENSFADMSDFKYQSAGIADETIKVLKSQKKSDGGMDIIAQVDYTFTGPKQKKSTLLTDPNIPLKVMIKSARHNYRADEKIVFDFQGNRDFYGCIIDLEPDGSIIQFLPNLKRSQKHFKGGKVHRMPDFAQGDEMALQVMPPFGKSVIIFVGSTVPLNLPSINNYIGDFNVFNKSEKIFLQELKQLNTLPPDSCTDFYEARWVIHTEK